MGTRVRWAVEGKRRWGAWTVRSKNAVSTTRIHGKPDEKA